MVNEGTGVDGGTAGQQGSPRSKVKFLCSYGGKILPRPSDGHLKYVGGETRVVAVPRQICFSELMKKLRALTESEMVLKYKIIPEDLDALVTVKTDEDLKHMIDEHDRHESVGIPKLRTFLFPPNPVTLESQVNPLDPSHSIEQRYIEAINGVFCTTTINTNVKLHPITANRVSFSISASSSPKSDSPEGNSNDAVMQTPPPPEGCCPGNRNFQSNRQSMHRVQSFPNICSHHCCPQAYHYHGHGCYRRHSPPYQQSHGYFTCRPISPGNERISALGWGAPSHGMNQFCPNRHNSGGCCEDCGHIYRPSSVPHSPKKHAFRL